MIEPQSPVGDPVDGLDHERDELGQVLAPLHVDMADECADAHVTVVAFDVRQPRDAADVDDQLRLGEPELEQGYEALAAGHDLGVVTALRQQAQRLVQCRWSSIVKGGREHSSHLQSTRKPTNPIGHLTRNHSRPRRSSPRRANLTTRSSD
jgi:hypothetical protein